VRTRTDLNKIKLLYFWCVWDLINALYFLHCWIQQAIGMVKKYDCTSNRSWHHFIKQWNSWTTSNSQWEHVWFHWKQALSESFHSFHIFVHFSYGFAVSCIFLPERKVFVASAWNTDWNSCDTFLNKYGRILLKRCYYSHSEKPVFWISEDIVWLIENPSVTENRVRLNYILLMRPQLLDHWIVIPCLY
jgi:hypothetical protein